MEENTNEKKGKGGKIALIIVGVVVALIIGLMIFGAINGKVGDKKDKTTEQPSTTADISTVYVDTDYAV